MQREKDRMTPCWKAIVNLGDEMKVHWDTVIVALGDKNRAGFSHILEYFQQDVLTSWRQ
jgi:hypothetical protein